MPAVSEGVAILYNGREETKTEQSLAGGRLAIVFFDNFTPLADKQQGILALKH